MTSDPSFETIRIEGLVAYRDAYELQVERREAVRAGTVDNALFLLEHTPVITLGRNSHEANILSTREALAIRGIEVVEADRGGDVTYHGPGQLVANPVLNLRQWRTSIRWYLRALERVIIDVLGDYGLAGRAIDGLTGVWVEDAKVAAIGVGLRSWVTYHGVSLNVSPDMAHYETIVACGLEGREVISLEGLLGRRPPMEEVMNRFEAHFARVFGAS